jgi:hypothetical protein
MRRFREDYPQGKNVLVCSDSHLFKGKKSGGIEVIAMGPADFRERYREGLRAT